MGAYLFAISLVLSLPAFAQSEKIDIASRFGKPGEAYEMLTYEEFRRLKPQSQREYIKDLREFFETLNRQGYSNETAAMSRYQIFAQLFALAGFPEIRAADPSECADVRFEFGGMNTICTGPLSCNYDQVGQTIRRCPETFKAWIAPAAQGAEPGNNELQLRSMLASNNLLAQKYGEEMRAGLEDKRVAVNGTLISASQPLQTSTALANPTIMTPETSAAQREREERLKQQEREKRADAAATEEIPPDPAMRVRTADLARNREQDTKIDEELRKQREECLKTKSAKECLKESSNGLACIYGGFVVEGKKCRHVDSFEDKKENKIYSCVKKDAPAGKTVVTPEPFEEGKPVLCNPLLFGLRAGKPMCVARSKRATRSCFEMVRGQDHAQELEEARKMMAANPEEYRKLRRAVENLCQGVNNNEIKKYIRENLGRSESSSADLADTCVTFAARFQSYREATGNQKLDLMNGTR